MDNDVVALARRPRPDSPAIARCVATFGAACAMAAALGGCLERTVKPVTSRIITDREAAERQREIDEAEAFRESAEEQEEDARDHLAEDPTNPRWNFEVGRYEEVRGDLIQAERLYRAGLAAMEPDTYTGPHLFIGRVLLKQGRLPEARRELERALAVKPKSASLYVQNGHYMEAHFLLGVTHYKLGDLKAARASFERYMELGGSSYYVVTYFPELAAAQ